jgi:hypothetical protein
MQFRRPLTKDEEEIRKRKGRVALLAWVLREEISNMDQFYHPERKKKMDLDFSFVGLHVIEDFTRIC